MNGNSLSKYILAELDKYVVEEKVQNCNYSIMHSYYENIVNNIILL